jgi:5-deoxy-glucuronate isomerase
MTTATSRLHWAAGELASAGLALELDQRRAGWDYSSLRVLDLAPGEEHVLDTGEDEVLVLPLAGGCTVECDGQGLVLHGRDDVFSSITDFAYVPREATARISSGSGGTFALPGAQARQRLDLRYVGAADVPTELRGTGSCSRQVVGYCLPESFEADRLIVCEVLTPAANWSSYPPHKHDEDRDGECILEEIYYFRVADGPRGADTPGVGYQRVYGTDERPIDVLAEVRTGDVVLIPHGWHGPSMAAPGYDLYYLNVMAGPGEGRAWLICDDPSHAWVRDTWADQDIDPRLPMIAAPGGGGS